MHVPTLHTERLRLEPLNLSHSEGMFRLWRMPEVCRFSGPAVDAEGRQIALPARTPADSDGIIAFFLAHQRTGRGFRWAVREHATGLFVGTLGFNALAPCAELAFHLHPEAWGRGYMNEAGAAAIAWLHTTPGVTGLDAWAEPGNHASHRLLLRLGFATDAGTRMREGARHFVHPFRSA